MNATQSITCCKAVPSIASHDVAEALLSNMLVTEYYDGAVSGFLQCPACGSVYHFVTVDWSQSHFVRVIALSLLPADSMSRLAAFVAEAPSKSPWIPQILMRPTDQDLDRIEAFLAKITAQAEPPSIILAWDIRTNEALSARKSGALSEDVVSLFDFDDRVYRRIDWFAELGLSRAS